ncbi:AAEL001873-PA [Aedes aegypti]|uniref:AAEL001873-PA n=1 Tax=Aedes aegypti TaxID=7159 RepID=Q17JY8_AEDAE|nr:AAEL001873-PA [Aedes aegypti]
MKGVISPPSLTAIIFFFLASDLHVLCNDAFESDSFFQFDDEPRTILYTAKPEEVTTTLPETTTSVTEAVLEPGSLDNRPLAPKTEPEPTTVCTPLQVLCQRIQETLETISNEIKQFQTKAMLEIVESERGQSTKSCGLVQLMQTIEQLQRQQDVAKTQQDAS